MKKIFASLMVLSATAAFGQDAQLTQVFNTPVLLNAAQTGLMDTRYRLTGGFRNTSFGSGMRAFNSGLFTAEMRLKGGFIPDNDRFGVGVYGYYDQSAAGALRSSYVGASLAYNKSLSASGATRIGVGAQVVYTSRSLNTDKLVFEDQFTSGGFSGVMTRDAVRGGVASYLDVNAGVVLSHNGDGWGGSLGGALQHVNRPIESFWGASYQLPLRSTAHGEVFWKLKGGDRLTLQGLFTHHAVTSYLQGGFIWSKKLEIASAESLLDMGLMWRNTRMLAPYLGLRLGNTRAALSYDLATSSSKQAGMSRQSLELTLGHGW